MANGETLTNNKEIEVELQADKKDVKPVDEPIDSDEQVVVVNSVDSEEKDHSVLIRYTEWANITLTTIAPLVGLVSIILYACSAGWGVAFSLIGKLTILSLASLIVGGLFGFLFGIPKTMQDNSAHPNTTKFIINTNLEQISDWLTKIIVGIGLIQIKNLPTYISRTHTYFQNNWGSDMLKDIGSVCICVICYFLFLGFLLIYLYTRINLTSLLKRYSFN